MGDSFGERLLDVAWLLRIEMGLLHLSELLRQSGPPSRLRATATHSSIAWGLDRSCSLPSGGPVSSPAVRPE